MTYRTISSFFERDHAEIDAILNAVDFESPREAVPGFEEFDRRLERHIGWEEDLLFPAVAAKAPQLERGPLRVMLMEHGVIREAKAAALAALRAGDAEGAAGSAGKMLDVLSQHNRKEEGILYPACDELLSAAEAAELFSRIERSRR